jgi:hypothetical protein
VEPYRALLVAFSVLAVGAGVVLTGVAAGLVGPGAGLPATLGLMAVATVVAGAAGYWLAGR